MDSVDSNSEKVFFLYAPDEIGKIFLINLLSAEIRSSYDIALATSQSVITAALLERGKTVHAALKLLLNHDNVEDPYSQHFSKL